MADPGRRDFSLDPSGVPLPRLLFGLLRQRFNGLLTLPAPGTTARILFKGGMPLFTDWAGEAPKLGELLVAHGACQASEVDKALAGSGDKVIGLRLLEAGAINAEQLGKALQDQCVRRLLPAFALREGTASITASNQAPPAELTHQVNVLALLLEGALRHYDHARVKTEMRDAPIDEDLAATPAFGKYLPQFDIPREAWPVVQALARGSRISRIAKPGLSKDKVAAIAYILWCCQMMRVGESATKAIAAGQTAGPIGDPPEGARSWKADKAKAKAKAEAEAKAAKAKADAKAKAAADAKAAEAAKIAEETKAFEPALAKLEEQIAKDDHAFALFGLELSAGRSEVRAAWAELSRRFHPDRLEALGLTELRSRVEPAFAALSEAYGVLSNKEQRAELVSDIEAGGRGKARAAATAEVRSAFEADMIAKEGDKLLKRGNFARALENYERAAQVSGDDPHIQASIHWCRFQTGPKDDAASKEAADAYYKLVADHERLALAHYYLGMILLHRGNESEAKVALQNAVNSDRHFVDAQRQLKAIQARRKAAAAEKEKASKKKGLRGFFSR